MKGLEWLRRVAPTFGFLTISLSAGCGEDAVGAACVPEDEYNPNFGGFSADGANVESRSFQCKSRICLVNRFQGRVTCAYGQDEAGGGCLTPDGLAVQTPVAPQLVGRTPDDSVYCSCRCDGEDPNAAYCECPEGFSCTEVVPNLPLASEELTGKYCIKEGTDVDDTTLPETVCDRTTQSCGPL